MTSDEASFASHETIGGSTVTVAENYGEDSDIGEIDVHVAPQLPT